MDTLVQQATAGHAITSNPGQDAGHALEGATEKTVRQKGFFEQVQMDVLVAISDSGTIQWPVTGSLLEVCKADQVPEKITQRVSEFRSATQLAGVLTAEHRRVVAEFLCKVHKPLTQGLGAPFRYRTCAGVSRGTPQH